MRGKFILISILIIAGTFTTCCTITSCKSLWNKESTNIELQEGFSSGYKSALNEYQQSLEILQVDLDKKNNEIENLNTSITKLTIEKQELQNQVLQNAEYQKKYEEIRNLLTTKENELNTLQQEKISLQTQIDSLQNQLNNLTQSTSICFDSCDSEIIQTSFENGIIFTTTNSELLNNISSIISNNAGTVKIVGSINGNNFDTTDITTYNLFESTSINTNEINPGEYKKKYYKSYIENNQCIALEEFIETYDSSESQTGFSSTQVIAIYPNMDLTKTLTDEDPTKEGTLSILVLAPSGESVTSFSVTSIEKFSDSINCFDEQVYSSTASDSDIDEHFGIQLLIDNTLLANNYIQSIAYRNDMSSENITYYTNTQIDQSDYLQLYVYEGEQELNLITIISDSNNNELYRILIQSSNMPVVTAFDSNGENVTTNIIAEEGTQSDGKKIYAIDLTTLINNVCGNCIIYTAYYT